MVSVPKKSEHLLRTNPFFVGLPDDDIQTIISVGTARSYTKNQPLFFQSDRAETFFIIITGCVKIHSETEDGEEVIVDLLTAGKTVGEASIFDGAIHPFSASATEPCTIFEVRASILKSQTQKSPALMGKIMTIMSEGVLELQKEKEHFNIMTAEQRVGCLLLKLTGGMVGNGGTFTLPYDKSLAAANLGIKPETFSRALKNLSSYGVTVNGSEVTIVNVQTLSEHCCVHCSSMGNECDGNKRKDVS